MTLGQRRKPPPAEVTVKVIRNTQAGRVDYRLPASVAIARYRAGELAIDVANGCYTEVKGGKL